MSKTVTQLTETTTLKTYDVFHVVDVDNDQDKKIKASNIWNNKPYGELFKNSNITTTTFAAPMTYYPMVTGGMQTTPGALNLFTHDPVTGRLTYVGIETLTMHINVHANATNATGANKNASIGVALNGALQSPMTVFSFSGLTTTYGMFAVTGLLTMATGDYIELYVANWTDTTAFVMDNLNVNITAL